MNKKNILVIFLILLAALCCMGAASAANNTTTKVVTAKDVLKDSSAVFYYSNAQKSTDYAYFYENTGAFAEDAYYGPYSFDATFDLSVKKLYKYLGYDKKDNYSYKKFQKDLRKAVDKDVISLDISGTGYSSYSSGYSSYSSGYSYSGIPGVVPENAPPKNVTATMSDDGSLLTVSYSYTADDYGHKNRVDIIKNIKKTKKLDFTIDFNDYSAKNYNKVPLKGDTISFDDVKVSKYQN